MLPSSGEIDVAVVIALRRFFFLLLFFFNPNIKIYIGKIILNPSIILKQ